MKGLIAFALVLLFSTACKKAEDRTCFKSWGEETTLEIPLESFDKLFLHAHIEYELVQDSTDKLVIIGGENMVKHIEWDINDTKTLSIRNKNKCNFLRNERKVIKVEIHYTNVFNIHFEGTEAMTSRGKLKTDYFVLFIRDGAGPVSLDLDCISVSADISNGWGDYTLKGTVQYARIGARSNGYCDTRDLIVSDSIYIAQESSGKVKVNCGNLPLYGYLKKRGNIEYIGQPSAIHIVDTGDGEILDMD